jgi:hypothetical protein
MDKKPVLKGITEAEAEEINIRIKKRINRRGREKYVFRNIKE